MYTYIYIYRERERDVYTHIYYKPKEGDLAAAVLSDMAPFDRVLLGCLHARALLLAEVQTPFLGTPLAPP